MNNATRWMSHLSALALAAGCTLPAVAAQADKYPTKSVRMIVPFAPGGGTDITVRIIAQKMSETLGQQVIVDNRAGAAGQIAFDSLVNAVPDGHTLLMMAASHPINTVALPLSSTNA